MERTDLRQQLRVVDLGDDGGPYLSEPPTTNDYVIEYDSSGNVWVAPPNTFEPVAQPNQDLSANADACNAAVSG